MDIKTLLEQKQELEQRTARSEEKEPPASLKETKYSFVNYKTGSGFRLPHDYLFVPASGWEDTEHWTGYELIPQSAPQYAELAEQITDEMSPEHPFYPRAMKLLQSILDSNSDK